MVFVVVVGVGLLVVVIVDFVMIDLFQIKWLEIISDDGYVVLVVISDVGGGCVDFWIFDGCNVM